jgi:localization factor PodJL
MRGASAHGPGERRAARNASPAAARLSGSGFRTWLRSVAPDAIGPAPAGACSPRPNAAFPPEGTDPSPARLSIDRAAQPDCDLSALSHRLDDVARQLERLLASETLQPQPTSAEGAPDLAALERQLKFLTTQLEILRLPCRADALIEEHRRQVANIAQVLGTVVSRSAFATLEDEVRALGARLDMTRCAVADGSAFAALEHGLAELRDAVRGLAPGELERAVHTLSRKIDQISDFGPDPLTFRELDKAIDALRGIVSQIASGDALAALVKEVRALGEKIEAATTKPLIEALAQKLDRFDLSADSESALEPIKQHISQLGEKIDRLHPSANDQVTLGPLGPLEQRLAQLAETLERMNLADGRWPAFAPMEERIRTLVEKLDQVEKSSFVERGGAATNPPLEANDIAPETNAAASQMEAARAVTESGPSPEQEWTPESASPQVEHATAAAALPAISLTPATAAGPEPARHSPPVHPATVETNLPPDAPIEPGSGPPRGRGNRGATHRKTARPTFGPTTSDRTGRPPSRSNFIVAARRAAQAANEPHNPAVAVNESIAASDPGAVSQNLAERVKSMFISTSLILVGLGAAGIALSSADLLGPSRERLADRSRPAEIARVALPAMPPSRLPTSSEAAAAPGVEATGSIAAQHNSARIAASQQPAQSPGKASQPNSGRPWSELLPAALATKPLLAGIAERNPAAAYEIGTRYAEGRGVPADMATAAVWFARAAEGGLAPAQFRLAAMYEKGLGVTKNLTEARRLYLAAAAKGHATAMHNIAVLYSEGVDGKPDFTAAVEWFRKAAEHGVGDSQYNLAVLYARGSGVEQNLAESFKWFSIAADKGDRDAGAKRDEIAAQLDPTTLAEARRAVSAFVAKPQPEEAMTVPAPPGGWDDADPAKPKPRAGNQRKPIARA